MAIRLRCPHPFGLLAAVPPMGRPSRSAPSRAEAPGADVPHGTTILAVRYREGVFVAGDRLASSGHEVFHRRVDKVYKVDDYAAIALSGIGGGHVIDVARRFTFEVEHYEKVEGEALSIDGKASVLARMVRMNLTTAAVGLIVVPILAGFDARRGDVRIFSYDVTGACSEEPEYTAGGSGGRNALASLKKRYRSRASREEALHTVAEALIDAADEDLATGSADLVRDVFPLVSQITRDGYAEVPASECRQQFAAVLSERAATFRGHS